MRRTKLRAALRDRFRYSMVGMSAAAAAAFAEIHVAERGGPRLSNGSHLWVSMWLEGMGGERRLPNGSRLRVSMWLEGGRAEAGQGAHRARALAVAARQEILS